MAENMTDEERRQRLEHHVVHDYSQLVSSGRIRLANHHGGVTLSDIPPVLEHVWHAFYLNCRKMFEFFTYAPKTNYVRAQYFMQEPVQFAFKNWSHKVQEHMDIHLLHVGDKRGRNVSWNGRDDEDYLADFERAWETFLKNLKPEHREPFREEITDRLRSTFRHCGTLGKEFIL